MKRLICTVALVAAALSIAVASAFAGAPANGGTTVPNTNLTFDGASCSAYFTKAASGIVNETRRSSGCALSSGYQFTAQFRPYGGTPSTACETKGLLTEFDWTNYDSVLNGVLPVGQPYHVCFYLLAGSWTTTGSIDSASSDGTMTALPVNGNYRIDVSGTWTNGSNGKADAEYTSDDDFATHFDGYDRNSWTLGEGFGDVQINNAFLNWGAYNGGHTYSSAGSFAPGALNLGVFDGDSTTNTKNLGFYGDNSGSLTYTITYTG